jgi:Fatty acid desaturase
VPVLLTQWRLEPVEGLGSDGERARDRLLTWMARLRRVATRMAAQPSDAGPLAEDQRNGPAPVGVVPEGTQTRPFVGATSASPVSEPDMWS